MLLIICRYVIIVYNYLFFLQFHTDVQILNNMPQEKGNMWILNMQILGSY